MPTFLGEYVSYDEIAFEGARLIDEYFSGVDQNSLIWTPTHILDETVLIYGDLYDTGGHQTIFKKLLRHLFERAGLQELSYVEYLEGGNDPIWIMLVEPDHSTDLQVAVNVCRCASLSWSVRKLRRHPRFPERRLDPVLKLLVPNYPHCDLNRPLDQLILASTVEPSTSAQSASERHSDTGGQCDE